MFCKKIFFYAYCYFFTFTPIKPPIIQNIKINTMFIIEDKLIIIFPEKIIVIIIFKKITIKKEIIEHIIGFILLDFTKNTVIIIDRIAEIIVIKILSIFSVKPVFKIIKLEMIKNINEIISGTVIQNSVFIICFFILKTSS